MEYWELLYWEGTHNTGAFFYSSVGLSVYIGFPPAQLSEFDTKGDGLSALTFG